MQSDFSEISSESVRSVLFEIVEEQLKPKEFQITLHSATKTGEHNFTGIVYRVTINKKSETENGKSKETSLILKVAPHKLARRTQFNVRAAFIREIYVYENILTSFREFERSKGIDIEKNGFTEYPKCYRTVDIDTNECLMFEDLCSRGFSTINRRTEDMTADHVRLVMQGLAKFHAISFALKDQQPDKFNELTANLSEVFISRGNGPLRYSLREQAKLVFNAVAGDKDLLAKVEEFYEKEAVDTAVDCLDIESTETATVIAYGDVHQNNIMFKYDSDGKPIEANFLDWQATRQSSPMIDIAFFIFCCTIKELRDAHYDEFLKVYHESLSAHIRRLGSDPEKLFPFDSMVEHLRKRAKYGLVLATVQLPVIISDTDFNLDLDGIGESFESGQKIKDEGLLISKESLKKLSKRLRDIVDDMVRLNYI